MCVMPSIKYLHVFIANKFKMLLLWNGSCNDFSAEGAWNSGENHHCFTGVERIAAHGNKTLMCALFLGSVA